MNVHKKCSRGRTNEGGRHILMEDVCHVLADHPSVAQPPTSQRMMMQMLLLRHSLSLQETTNVVDEANAPFPRKRGFE